MLSRRFIDDVYRSKNFVTLPELLENVPLAKELHMHDGALTHQETIVSRDEYICITGPCI